jgi:rhamnosyltransferase
VLFSQSRLDFEVIIVDSSSIDNTSRIIKTFPIRKKITIPKKTFHYSYALNLGIKEAWGEYIGILSGHSVPVDKNWYSNGLSHFYHKSVVAVTGYCTSLPDGTIQEKLRDLNEGAEIQKIVHYTPWMTNTNALIRKSLWCEYPFDERITAAEDYDWASEMVARGWDVIKDPLFNVFHSHGGLKRKTYVDLLSKHNHSISLIDKKPRPGHSFSTIINAPKQISINYPKYIINKSYSIFKRFVPIVNKR